MSKQVFILNDKHDDYEEIISSNDVALSRVTIFLTDNIGIDEDRWKNRLINDKDSEIFCNTEYVKKEGNSVFLGWFIDPDFDKYPDPSEYKTTVSEFLNMISAWFRLHEERPNKIILEVEGEKIRLYGEE